MQPLKLALTFALTLRNHLQRIPLATLGAGLQAFAVTLLVFGCLALLARWWQSRAYDLLIVRGTIVDGTGAAPYVADVAIRDGKIVGISRWQYRGAAAKRRLEASGRIVAPGFIDVHTHVEANLPTSQAFRPANFLKQGVTTLITGNCGRSHTDLAAMFTTLEKYGTYLNVASLVGHNTLRRAVLGTEPRAASAAELQEMENLVAEAMDTGALGLSSGLAYMPGRFAKTEELIALAQQAAQSEGLYVSHIRDEAAGGVAALEEALHIGQAAGAVTQISHLKCSGQAQWHTMPQRLETLADLRAAGVPVFCDLYPYDRSSTTTDILLPDWAVANQRAALKQAAGEGPARQRLRDEIRQKLQRDGWQKLDHVQLIGGPPEWRNATLAAVPRPAQTLTQQIENLIEVSLRGGAQAIYADMNEEDVAAALQAEFSVLGSDSAVRYPASNYKPHPRGSGTFPRVFSQYVRTQKLLTLSQAVRKTSGLAAEIFKLNGRGILRSGAWADVVIFDAATIDDRADYDDPLADPRGIDYVIVNGNLVVEQNQLVSTPPAGRALRHRTTQ